MKIRLAILDRDSNYLNRIVYAFSTKYADKLEVYSFTGEEQAISTVKKGKAEVFLADESFVIQTSELPQNCAFGYLVSNNGIELLHNQPAIGKYQKADLIYRQILSLYSEKTSVSLVLTQNDDGCRVIAFSSPCGGCGCSSMAAAFAISEAKNGRRPLYLNLETFGSPEPFFSAEGQFTMRDIIFTLKSRKTNLTLKLESCIRQDENGVSFFAASDTALDMLSLTSEETLRLISEIRLSGLFDTVILDMDFGLNKDQIEVFRQCSKIILVGDGSETSNYKIHRALSALQILEESDNLLLLSRIHILYNKFSNKTGGIIKEYEDITYGGAPKYEHAKTDAVVRKLAELQIFAQIMM